MDESHEREELGGNLRRSKRNIDSSKRKLSELSDPSKAKRKKSGTTLVASSSESLATASKLSTSPISHRTRSCTTLSTLGASSSRSSPSLPGSSSQPNRLRVTNCSSDTNVAYAPHSRNSKRSRSSGVIDGTTDSTGPSSDRSASSSATSLSTRCRASSSSGCLSKPSSASSISDPRGEASGTTSTATSSSNVRSRKHATAGSNSSIDATTELSSGSIPAQEESATTHRRLRLRKQTSTELEPTSTSRSKLSKRFEKRALGHSSSSGASGERESSHSKLRRRLASLHSKSSDDTEQGALSGPGGLRQSLRKKRATGSCASNNVAPEQPSTSGQDRTNDAPQSANDIRYSNKTHDVTGSQGSDGARLDEDLSRLQALLEARGLPPHLFGSLGPRMHQLLHRSMSGGINGKIQQLLGGIQSNDECQQLQAVMELCQILVMGNEDTLGGFPIKQAVPALINLLAMEHNFEMMNHACRALTYLMEALPRSSVVVVDAVPTFLMKLQSIQCMDVAEQALTALEMLSRRHGKPILQAEGMTACLTYLDFFSITAQRAALAIAANCCQFVNADDFHLIEPAIPILSAKLQIQDKKSIQSCCLAFARLVDNLHKEEKLLRELADHGLLTNVQQLLVVSPPVVSTGTFVAALRMMAVMCANCPYVAVELLKNNIAETLRFLLMGASESEQSEPSELSPRTPQEFYEITCLISELLPELPSDGIFACDSLLNKGHRSEHGHWQWKDDHDVWHAYSWIDGRIIEAAHQSGEDELSLNTLGRNYIVDFTTMQQVNEDTGTSRPIQRCSSAALVTETVSSEDKKEDERATFLQEGSPISTKFTLALFGELNEVHNSSVGAVVRHKCLNAILRMLYYSPPELLNQVIVKFPVSSQMAGMLVSSDLRTVVNALQMAHILMQKLPEYFHVHFRREGVMHKIHELASSVVDIAPCGNSVVEKGPCGNVVIKSEAAEEDTSQSLPEEGSSLVPPSRKLSDVLKRKRRSKRISYKKSASLDAQSTPGAEEAATPTRTSSFSSFPSSVLTSLRCESWQTTGTPTTSKANKTPVSSNATEGRNKVKAWIKEQAVKFSSTYFENEDGETHPALEVLLKLSSASNNLGTKSAIECEAFKIIARVLSENEKSASAFEILHSGLIPKLLSYLTCPVQGKRGHSQETRVKTFLQAFLGCPAPEAVNDNFNGPDRKYRALFAILIQKLHGCVNQQEQFPVKIHDAPGGCGNGSRGLQTLRFFNSHQIKCFLQRQPGCMNVKNWRGGPVKIDPLALVQAIERYLVLRGYGRVREDADEEGSDDDVSEEDIEEALAFQNLGSQRHYLDIMIGDKVLPYNMTVYQAVKQYGQVDGERDNEEEGVLGRPSIWVGTHTIYYRATTNTAGKHEPSSSKGTSVAHPSKSSKKSPGKRNKDALNDNNNASMLGLSSPADSVAEHGLKDCSLEGIYLLRTLYHLNANWGAVYGLENRSALISPNEFISTKLTAKATRQLQDPIAIMTGNFPQWLGVLAQECSFLFPFECRQQLFYCSTFDRDRAMSKLQETIPDLLSAEATDRVTPRLERKKRTVSRDDIYKQAEAIINEVGSSRAILEIQYQDEVGTGLGPTLEFYALVSKEFQRADLAMWRGDSVPAADEEDIHKEISYVFSSVGLYPAPIAKNTKASVVTKLKAKFRFLGKFIAKAIMDFRMLDIPLSPAFFKWMLCNEDTLGHGDLCYIDPILAKSVTQLQDIVIKRKRLEQDPLHTADSLKLAVETLTMDGLPIEDLDLDFRLPGTNIDLKKGGKDVPVTIHNVEEYVKLVVQWTLVDGVVKQMSAFKEGFESVFPLSSLSSFSPAEMDLLLCGSSVETWDMKSLMENCRPDHGYTHDSRAVKFLFEILSSYNRDEQRRFLQFVTGSPKLPVGGFKRLTPPLKIVRKTLEAPLCPDSYLPSVMTCMNYLKLPDYSTKEIMKEKLKIAAVEGQHSFHLS